MNITTYVVVDENNQYASEEHDTMQEAINDATQRGNAAVVELQYEFTDSELVWTPNGGNVWPVTS